MGDETLSSSLHFFTYVGTIPTDQLSNIMRPGETNFQDGKTAKFCFKFCVVVKTGQQLTLSSPQRYPA